MSVVGRGLRFGTARLATGPQIHYAEGGDPAGEAILLLHGWPDSWFSWSRVLPFLPPAYRTLAWDERGFGDSERPDAGYGIDNLAADAVAFLDAVAVRRATVVGHSLGTFIARRVAERHPERVIRLALIGSAFRPVNAVTREVQASLRDLAEPVPLDFARAFQRGTVHLPVPPEFFDGLIAASVKAPARVWRAGFDGLLRFDDTADLERIAAPTLILWGEHDALFGRDDQGQLTAAIPGARLIEYRDTGHCPNWERPERVAADLTAFLRETR